jgi:hypothetical protein
MGGCGVCLRDQIRDVFAAIQQPSNVDQRFTGPPGIPLRKFLPDRAIDFTAHGFEAPARGLQLGQGIGLADPEFLDRHIQIENLFQQFRGNVFRGLLADIEALEFEQI